DDSAVDVRFVLDDSIAKDLAAEVRRLVLAGVQVQIAADEPLSCFLPNYPVAAFPFTRGVWHLLHVVETFDEVDSGHGTLARRLTFELSGVPQTAKPAVV